MRYWFGTAVGRVLRFLVVFVLLVCSSNAVKSQVVIEMSQYDNVFMLPGKVNGLKLNFIFDTGATNVCLSLSEALFMLKNGYLDASDIKGTSYAKIANGDIVENTEVLLREIEIGGMKIYNVKASISHSVDAPLLLGLSAIQKLGSIQIDGTRLIINNGVGRKSDEKAYEYYQKGFQCIENEQYNEALEYLDVALQYAESSNYKSAIYGEMARVYHAVKNYDMCVICCNKGLGENLYNELLSRNYGIYLYEMGRVDQAEKALIQHVRRFENQPSVKKDYLAAVYTYLGDVQKEKGELVNAERSYMRSIGLVEHSQALLGLADLYYQQERYDQAAVYYERALQYEPNRLSNAKRWYQLGCSYNQLGNRESAKTAFKKSVDIANVFLSKYSLDSIDEALKEVYYTLYVQALQSFLWLARLSDSHEEMLYNYQTVITYNEMDFEIGVVPLDFVMYSQANMVMGIKEDAKKISDYALQLYPTSIDVLFNASLFLESIDEKISMYNRILKFEYTAKPLVFDYATLYSDLASCYCRNGQYAEALKSAEKAVEYNQAYDYAWGVLGEAYYFLGRYDDCINAMTKCIEIDGLPSVKKNALYYRGQSYIKLKKYKLGNRDIEASEAM